MLLNNNFNKNSIFTNNINELFNLAKLYAKTDAKNKKNIKKDALNNQPKSNKNFDKFLLDFGYVESVGSGLLLLKDY